jgi:hypothetical protein
MITVRLRTDVHSWTGSLQLTFKQQSTSNSSFFWEPLQPSLRNSTHDELPEPWQKVPVAILKHRELSMKQNNRFAAVVIVATSLLSAPAVYAAPASISSPIHAMFSKTKMVKLSLRNDSGAAMDVKVGDKIMTLAPGKPVDLSLPVGTRIVANTATPNHEVGSLIEEVVSEHNGATISIR